MAFQPGTNIRLDRPGLVSGSWLVFALAVCAASGCGDRKSGVPVPDSENTPGPSSTDLPADEQPASSQTTGRGDEARAALTPDAYEALLLALATCPILGEHIDPKCPARQAFQEARTRANTLPDLSGLTARLGREHIAHESPAVRMQTAAFLTSVFGADPSNQGVFIAAARAEKEPAVLASMLQAVGAKGGESPEIGELLLDMASHPSPAVRKKVMVWLGSSWNAALEGSLDTLIDRIENDPDQEVRRFACKYSGDRGDDRMIPIYEKYTADPAADPKLYAACMEGLMNSWLHYPRFQTHSEKAYRLALKRLAYTPRSKDAPPWTIMDDFAELGTSGNKKVEEWRGKIKGWFSPREVIAVLRAIAVDPQAYRLARTGAVRSMVALGASKKQLEALRAAHSESSDSYDDQEVVKEIDRALAAMP